MMPYKYIQQLLYIGTRISFGNGCCVTISLQCRSIIIIIINLYLYDIPLHILVSNAVHLLLQCLQTPYVLMGGGCTETVLSHFLLSKV